jgi:4-hydroxy-tetrahydrodipicolinate reductase
MKLALLGYGKMGKTIERLAIEKGHDIVFKSDESCIDLLIKGDINKAEVVIEFTGPKSAPDNIKACISGGIPVVSGSTGWLKDHWDDVSAYCAANGGSFFYASNFSIGVNIFFEINERLAKLMSAFPEYKAEIEEIHHVHKLDAPSGTGITLAEGIFKNHQAYKDWILEEDVNWQGKEGKLQIISKRIDEVPGTHITRYQSPIDDLEISHIAKGREGFASGAILAAEFIRDKKGIYGMKDLLKL